MMKGILKQHKRPNVQRRHSREASGYVCLAARVHLQER
jgi:hypothetical protein